jgi:hypothetical protein
MVVTRRRRSVCRRRELLTHPSAQLQLLDLVVGHPGRLRLRGDRGGPDGVVGVGDIGHDARLLHVAHLLDRGEDQVGEHGLLELRVDGVDLASDAVRRPRRLRRSIALVTVS